METINCVWCSGIAIRISEKRKIYVCKTCKAMFEVEEKNTKV